MALLVGGTYQLYTKYESIAGIKVRIVGTLAYSECKKISFNMTVLAIDERIISIKEENLEEFIGNDTIYHCRAIDPNSDGTYSEYIVWDSIVNMDKTIKINTDYNYTLTLTVSDNTIIPISQIISNVSKFITNNYGSSVNHTLVPAINTDINGEIKDTNDDITGEKLENIKSILNKLSSFENKLIPAAEKITSADLSNKLTLILNDIDTISSGVSIIAKNI